MTFLEAAIQVRFESEKILAFLKYTLPIKIWLLAILAICLFPASIMSIAAGYVEDGFKGGLLACANFFIAGWMQDVRERGKKGFYDQPFHPDIYAEKDRD